MEKTMKDLAGEWTYRSFLNDPQPVTTPDEALSLIFCEGALTITNATPGDGFHATLSFGGESVMELTGEVVAGSGQSPMVAHVNGRGRPGSPVADFAYDYIFYAVPDWPEGVAQRDALIGTVVRA